jgi:hypothetical protein
MRSHLDKTNGWHNGHDDSGRSVHLSLHVYRRPSVGGMIGDRRRTRSEHLGSVHPKLRSLHPRSGLLWISILFGFGLLGNLEEFGELLREIGDGVAFLGAELVLPQCPEGFARQAGWRGSAYA